MIERCHSYFLHEEGSFGSDWYVCILLVYLAYLRFNAKTWGFLPLRPHSNSVTSVSVPDYSFEEMVDYIFVICIILS